MKRKIVSLLITGCFVMQQAGFCQLAAGLQVPLVGSAFRPLHLRSIALQPAGQGVDLVLDKGDAADLQPQTVRSSTDKLMEYFLIGISLPNDSFWVNLRPDSPSEMIDPRLEKTDLGRVLLEADLQLKKDMAALTSPDTASGREYWDQLYAKAEQLFGSDSVEIPALTRPWIVPGEVIIAQTFSGAYVYKATLNVMLEQDYLKDQAQFSFNDPRVKALNEYSSQLVRSLLLPQLIRAVNTSKRYAQLRQVYYSLILAQWFKQRYAKQATASKHPFISRINSANLDGLVSQASWSKMDYFKAYEKSFSQGEYRKEEQMRTPTGLMVRTYFSGGAVIDTSKALQAPGAVVNAVNGRIPEGAGYLRISYDGAARDGGKTVELSAAERSVQIIVGTSGWRSRMDTGEFTANNVGRLAKAIAEELLAQVAAGEYVPNNGESLRVLVAYDARKGGLEFAQRIVETLAAYGIEADIGSEYATTPAVIAQTRGSLGKDAYDLALHVTASHNDVRYNGVKFLKSGVVAPDSLTGRFAERANDEKNNADYRMIPFEKLKVKEVDIIGKTIERYRHTFPALVKAVKTYRTAHPDFQLVVDVLHGSAGPYVRLFEEMGAAIVRTAPMREGTYPQEKFLEDGQEKLYRPEPKELFLDKESFNTFKTSAADGSMYIGIDGDGDRAAVWVKHAGEAIEFAPNKLGLLYGWYLLSTGRTADASAIAKTLPTSYAMDVLAKKYDLPIYITPVGSKHFAPYMMDSSDNKAVVAIEESGHAGLRIGQETWFDDATTQAMLMMEIVAHYQADLVSVMRMAQDAIGYESVDKRVNKDLTDDLKTKITTPLQDDPAALAAQIEKSVGQKAANVFVTTSDDQVVTLDELTAKGLQVKVNEGMNLQFVMPEGIAWVQMRLSGTEPVARVYTEAPNEQLRQTLEDAVSKALGMDQAAAGAVVEDEETAAAEAVRLARIEPAVKYLLEAGLFGKNLTQAQKDEIIKLFDQEIGSEKLAARLGWVIPPSWEAVQAELQKFLDLPVVQGKKNFVFSGMGGSINTVKAVNTMMKFLADQGMIKSDYTIYTIDSLDPAAMKNMLKEIGDKGLEETLVVGISKSVTTKETQDLLKTLREKFTSNTLAINDHFLWMIDEENRENMAKTGWDAYTATRPIQVDGETDIGGRFTAPHTLIYLVPALLMLNKDLTVFERGWKSYLEAVKKLQTQVPAKVDRAVAEKAQKFAIVVKDQVTVDAIETWIVQLFQESLGSKKTGFDPKTVVITEDQLADYPDFYPLRFEVPGKDSVIDTMLTMYFSQLFVALLASEEKINFVDQDAVQKYKKAMNEASGREIPAAERAGIEEIAARTADKNAGKKFVEAVCYWDLSSEQRAEIKASLAQAFPQQAVLVFQGSDWNHHSYQAAESNTDTLFLILTKPAAEYAQQINGVPQQMLQENIDSLRTIAYATYTTLEDKAGYFELSAWVQNRDGGILENKVVTGAPAKTGGVDLRAVPMNVVSSAVFPENLKGFLAECCRNKQAGKPAREGLDYLAQLLRSQEDMVCPAEPEVKAALAYLSS